MWRETLDMIRLSFVVLLAEQRKPLFLELNSSSPLPNAFFSIRQLPYLINALLTVLDFKSIHLPWFSGGRIYISGSSDIKA
jgi:hypothetical protein